MDQNYVNAHINSKKLNYIFTKRIIDIVGSLILILILTPMYIWVVTTIYIRSGLPILYKWNIVGFKGKHITSWKFRTMIIDADNYKEDLLSNNEMKGPLFKIKNDPRITVEGKLFRKYSIDESIQLFSILKGNLSLVGPRPPLQSEWKNYNHKQRKKLSMKPGLTGLWQVSGRNRIDSFDAMLSLDMDYIENWNLLLDIKILFLTIPAIIKGTGY